MKKTGQQKPALDSQKTLLSFWQGSSNKNTTNQNNAPRKPANPAVATKQTASAKSTYTNKPQSSFFNTKASTDQLIILDEDSNSNPTKALGGLGYPYESMSDLANLNFDEDTGSNYTMPSVRAVDTMDCNDDDDMEDLELIQTTDTFLKEKSFNRTSLGDGIAGTSVLNQTEHEIFDRNAEKLTIGIDDNLLVSTQHVDTNGFDATAGSVWIYPNNMTVRSYQYSIVERCLHRNTMVVLPTGMGKTFIAAVVMFNFYRWYPLGKVVFMAPTKPLVTQQADACYKIVGIPNEDMTFMTGNMPPEKRKLLWASKRVFFITPQVIANDIMRGDVDVNLIKCVVIDEAHKALGEYAFCKVCKIRFYLTDFPCTFFDNKYSLLIIALQVIESVNEVNKNFRIVALTATPGSDTQVDFLPF
jgi:hypothetical protein